MAPHFFLPQALEVFPTLTLREPPPLLPSINIAITSSLHSSQILGPFPSVLWPFSLFTLTFCDPPHRVSVLMSWLPFLSLSLLSSSPLCFFPSFSSLYPSSLPHSFSFLWFFVYLFETKPLYIIPASFELASVPKVSYITGMHNYAQPLDLPSCFCLSVPLSFSFCATLLLNF